MRAPRCGTSRMALWDVGALPWLAACAKAPGPAPAPPPPLLVASSRAAGQLRVAADATISVTFSRPLATVPVTSLTVTADCR